MLDLNNIKMLEIDLTGTCNLNCPLCARNYNDLLNNNRIYYNERKLDDIINQIEKFPNLNKINLVGSTSEPTLYKKLFQLIEWLNQKNIEIEICTNGDTHNEEYWNKLGKLLKKNDSVYFTICGSNQELHETYRVNCSLEKLLENAKSFKNKNKNDYVQHILFDYNKDDLKSKEMQNIIKQFNNVNYTKTYFTRDINNYKNKFNIEKLEIYNEHLEYYKAAVNYGKKLIQNKKNKKINCTSYNDGSLHIDQSGNIYPCYIFLEESNHKIWDKDYQKILDFEYDCCRYCEKNLSNILALKGCELL